MFFSHPAAVKAIFSDGSGRLQAVQSNAMLRPVLGERSLMLQDGAAHMRQRRMLAPPFKGKQVCRYADLMRRIVESLVRELPLERPFALQSWIKRLSLDIIIRIVFGVHNGARAERLRELLGQFVDHLSGSLTYIPALQTDLGAWSPWGRFLRVRRALHEELQAEIDARRCAGCAQSGEDVIGLLLEARDGGGESLTDEELRAQLVTLLATGHDTNASALAFAIEHLCRNPAAEERLVDELGHGRDPLASAGSPYLDAVCKETLRWVPIVPAVNRKVTAPVEIEGWRLEPGVAVSPCIFLVHRRADLYERPHEFRPERFLERQYAPYEFLPFGGGTRHCIGAPFAMAQMKLVLATLVERFRLRVSDPRPLRTVRRHVTLCPRGGTRVVARLRRPAAEPRRTSSSLSDAAPSSV